MLPEKEQQLLPSSLRVARNGAMYGALAGLLATWSISTAIAASEVELHLPVGTFYAVMATSLGLAGSGGSQLGAYVGFGLHLLTGTVLGAAIGALAASFSPRGLLNPYRSLAFGLAAGMAVWLALFLPVTALVVRPSLERAGASLGPLFVSDQFVLGIALSAIAFHLVWGAAFGYVSSSLLRIRVFRALPLAKKGADGREEDTQ
jgi:hypothetical protein